MHTSRDCKRVQKGDGQSDNDRNYLRLVILHTVNVSAKKVRMCSRAIDSKVFWRESGRNISDTTSSIRYCGNIMLRQVDERVSLLHLSEARLFKQSQGI